MIPSMILRAGQRFPFTDEETGALTRGVIPVSDKACWGLSSGFLDTEPGPFPHACSSPGPKVTTLG